jgi:coniferyl-aldehyde dehydrogenase
MARWVIALACGELPMDTSQSNNTLKARFEAQRAAFKRQPMPDPATRRQWLDRLADLLKNNEQAICEAISADFGHRPHTETRLLELFPSREAVRYAQRKVARWMKPERRHVSLWFKPARAEVRYQPLGVVGIIVPWNYPLYLSVGPLVSALAAGNRVMLKMSEFSRAFGDLFARLIRDTFPEDLVIVVLGGPDVATEFSALLFDHMLFTGSTSTGRRVMGVAASNLTPVTLELGGKSPVIIAPGQNLARAAQRIVFAKLVNGGQTCVAPDYVLLHKSEEQAFLAEARKAAQRFYGNPASPDYASAAHARQHARLIEVIVDADAKGARIEPVLPTGETVGRKIAPVAVLECNDGMRVIQEEIFGPILPIVPYERLDEAVAYVNGRDRPLSLYIFDNDRARVASVLDATASGGVVVNDCLLHVAQEDLPFGGVGPSGMGRYHGPEGFKTFSQVRSVLRQSSLASISLLYPPYGGALTQRLLRVMLR